MELTTHFRLLSRLVFFRSMDRDIVTYGCEIRAMTVTEQNCLLIFERRVLRKIYRRTQNNDGTWRIKTNEELEILIKKKESCKIHKITKITLGSSCNQNGHNKNCQKN